MQVTQQSESQRQHQRESLAVAVHEVYERLLAHYGPQGWWPAQTRFEMMVGAILTQSVAWSNVEKAMANLREAQALDPALLHSMAAEELAPLLRPAGYYNAKARKVKSLVAHLHDRYRYDLDRLFAQDVGALREELLFLYGVGPETADSIILYAAQQPVFVVDAYTRRLASRLGWAPPVIGYDDLQKLFTGNLPRDSTLFQEYHALIVRHAKSICRKQPQCADCLLLCVCAYGQQDQC